MWRDAVGSRLSSYIASWALSVHSLRPSVSSSFQYEGSSLWISLEQKRCWDGRGTSIMRLVFVYSCPELHRRIRSIRRIKVRVIEVVRWVCFWQTNDMRITRVAGGLFFRMKIWCRCICETDSFRKTVRLTSASIMPSSSSIATVPALKLVINNDYSILFYFKNETTLRWPSEGLCRGGRLFGKEIQKIIDVTLFIA